LIAPRQPRQPASNYRNHNVRTLERKSRWVRK